MRRVSCCLLLLLLAAPAWAGAFDWPQWQGPDRNARSKQTGLLKEWPKDGPPLVWEAKKLGGGYSTPSVADGRVFGMSYRGKDEVVWALDEKTGGELWAARVADAARVGYGEGSRCTPTVDGGLLYALGCGGDLVCLDVKDGKEVWRKNLKRDFGGQMMSGWGYSESPLVDGDRLLVTPGGKDATVVALDKKTGALVWKCPVPGGDGAGYASMTVVQVAGNKEYVQFLGKGVVGVSADGLFLWRYDKCANGTANISTPVFADGQLFAASAYGRGGALLTPPEGAGKPNEVYFTKKMENHHGGMLLIDGALYGANGGNSGGFLVCLDWKTGAVNWDERDRNGVTKGSVAFADGRIYYRQEDGTVLLIEPSTKECLVRGRFKQPDRSRQNAWPHPVLANGKLYLRDQDVLLCYDVAEKK